MAGAMMGEHQEQKNLFSYGVDLDRRVRADNPLRLIRQQIDFSWVREEVAGCYGCNGHVSVDPVVILKLMFVLFYDDVKSERELMRIVPERLDYLWFLGLSLDDEIPDHSVLSKARARWGAAVFEKLFVGTVAQCVEAGLVDGGKIHMDGSLIQADASRDSVVRSSPELISALKAAYQVQEHKLEGNLGNAHYQSVNKSMLSTTDPEAPVVRHSKHGGSGDSRPRYKHHRIVDDKCGVITAALTTPGDIDEPKKSLDLLDEHEANTGQKADTAVADQQYGTNDNYRQLQQRGVRTHIGALFGHKKHKNYKHIFPRDRFRYDEQQNVYICPAGESLKPRRQVIEYKALKSTCDACTLRAQCTRAKTGRSIMHHDAQELIDLAHRQAASTEARRDRSRRRHLMEGSFADAARHHFKRSRWRRLRRQQIQDHIIAAIQNIKILIKAAPKNGPLASESASFGILSFLCAALRRRQRSTWPIARFCSISSFGFPL